jgi:uncharacterized protein (AIM24 family)
MAKFEIEQTEGMRWIKVALDDESIRAERGALNHMHGDIRMDLPLPSLRATLASFLSEESFFRPRYRGTGHVVLESSLGGFHPLDVKDGEVWVINSGAYCARTPGLLFRRRAGGPRVFRHGPGIDLPDAVLAASSGP